MGRGKSGKIHPFSFPYMAFHLFAILASMVFIHFNSKNSRWIDFTLYAYPVIMAGNGIATFFLRELGNTFHRVTKATFKMMLILFIPFLLIVLFF